MFLKGGTNILSSHITAIYWYILLWHMHFSGAYRWYFVPWVLLHAFCFLPCMLVTLSG